MKIYKIYAGGEFVTSAADLVVSNSYTQEIYAKTYFADKLILEKSIIAAQNAMQPLKNLSSFEKYSILMDIADKMQMKKTYLAEVLSNEACKPLKYAIGEIDRAIQTVIVAAEEAKRIEGEYISIDWTAVGKGKEGWVKYFPVGLIAGIAPFNFPLNLAIHKIAPAIAAACPIILKPASSTPLSTLELAEIINETSLPKGALSVLPMDRNTGNQLVTDERFKLLTFTGSPEVGWKMKNDAGKKKVVLELGGNAGVIITETADLDVAVNKCVVGGFAYSGQVCIHAQRIYVHYKIFNEFTENFSKAVEKLKVGNPLEKDTDMSSMIDIQNAIRVEEWANEAIENGARLICGGKRENAYYPPTILTDTHKDMKVCAMEVFGPVVTLEAYDDFETAIDYINDSRYGLQAGVFTNAINEMNMAFDKLEVGGVVINDVPTFRVDHAPYGGIKDSGLGREGVKYAIKDMLEAKILIKPF